MKQRVRKHRGVLPLVTASVVLAALGGTFAMAQPTDAAFSDVTYANTDATTQLTEFTPPVLYDQSSGSALFIDDLGRLFISGQRNYGDGMGNNPSTAPVNPNEVVASVDGVAVKFVDAAGSSNDFGYNNQTAYMALDTEGRVWTWGKPFNDYNNLGRGANPASPYTAGLVTQTAAGDPLPKIIDMERAENQFYALDETGTMWTWGYQNENLARNNTSNHQLPAPANAVTTSHGSGSCALNSQVVWHSIWGGNNGSAGVSTKGLIYTWGYDNPNGVSNDNVQEQRCPMLNESANRALFEAYPTLYTDAQNQAFVKDSLATEALRHQRYLDIVANITAQPNDICAGVLAKTTVDLGACPVRQFGYSARAPRLLLQNGDLYTWKISSANYGDYFLGRTPTSMATNTWQNAGSAYAPTKVALANINYVVAGVSSLTAITNDGKVYGWGSNNFCQAIGQRMAGGTDTCASSTNEVVVPPTLVGGIPGDATITRLGGTQCATWAQDAVGQTWAWGGGFIVSNDYRSCVSEGISHGFKIYNTFTANETYPFGAPVQTASTGTVRVR